MSEDKESFIHNLFSRIAGKYDLLNDVMTFSQHRKWKHDLIEHAASGIQLQEGAKILDLCSGTGDIADMWIPDSRVAEVIAIDSCAPMLQVGYSKLQQKYNGPPPKLRMIEADALELPFDDKSFDAVTVGFGLRNVSDPDKALQEVYRVLKPGGCFASLDLGHPSIPLIDFLHKKIFLRFVPILGFTIAHDKDAYQYLVDSLKTWPKQKDFCQALYDFGFTRAYYKDLMLGTVAIIVAQK